MPVPSNTEIDAAVPAAGTPHRGQTNTLFKAITTNLTELWDAIGALAPGAAVLHGAGAPAGGTGADGDLYFNRTNWDVYGPKTAGAWGSPTRLITQTVLDGEIATLQAQIAAFVGGLSWQGNWDASAGTFPGAGSAQNGYFYKVSVAGTVGGVEFGVGDTLIALVDDASTSVYADNWQKFDNTDQVASVAGLIGVITAAALGAQIAGDATAMAAITAALAINGLVTAGTFTSGDKVVILKAGVGVQKIDFDQLPATGVDTADLPQKVVAASGDLIRGADGEDGNAEVAFPVGPDFIETAHANPVAAPPPRNNADWRVLLMNAPNVTPGQRAPSWSIPALLAWLSEAVVVTDDDYVVSDTDNCREIYMVSAAAHTITIPAGLTVPFIATQGGAGAVTVIANTGVSLNGVVAGSTALGGQYESASIAPVPGVTDAHRIAGKGVAVA